jgi:hypothetical protein
LIDCLFLWRCYFNVDRVWPWTQHVCFSSLPDVDVLACICVLLHLFLCIYIIQVPDHLKSNRYLRQLIEYAHNPAKPWHPKGQSNQAGFWILHSKGNTMNTLILTLQITTQLSPIRIRFEFFKYNLLISLCIIIKGAIILLQRCMQKQNQEIRTYKTTLIRNKTADLCLVYACISICFYYNINTHGEGNHNKTREEQKQGRYVVPMFIIISANKYSWETINQQQKCKCKCKCDCNQGLDYMIWLKNRTI